MPDRALRAMIMLDAATALLLLVRPDQAQLPFKLLVFAVCFFMAYRCNRDAGEGPDSTMTMVRLLLAGGALVALNLVTDSAWALDNALGDNLAVGFVLLAFAARQTLVRDYGFIAAWLAFNVWLFLLPGVNAILAPLFVLAAVYQRFMATAQALGDEYGAPDHGSTPLAGRQLFVCAALALLLYLPLLGWGWSADRAVRRTLGDGGAVAGETVRARQLPQEFSAIGLALIVVGIALWRLVRQPRRKRQADQELQRMLSAQGYVSDLPPAPDPGNWPGGCRGQVLKLYDRLLRQAGKKLERNLYAATPAQREEQLRRLYPERPWSELTAIFNRARYSAGEITAADVAAARKLAN